MKALLAISATMVALVVFFSGQQSLAQTPPRVSSGYLSTTNADGDRRWGGRHAGADFRVRHGTPVIAAAPGEVLHRIIMSPKCGDGVVIFHERFPGELFTIYCHLSRFAVGDNVPVERGEIIGYVGSSGNAQAPELHFELSDEGGPHDSGNTLGTRDPLKYMAKSKKGCFVPGEAYADNELTLPLVCRGVKQAGKEKKKKADGDVRRDLNDNDRGP